MLFSVWPAAGCCAATAASRAATRWPRAATKITLRDVVELLEGVDLNRCGLSLEDDCPCKITLFYPTQAKKNSKKDISRR